MDRTQYEETFDTYWESLLKRFKAGKELIYSPLEVSPGRGNKRRVERIEETTIVVRETTSKRRRNECSKSELRDDFWKLCQDSEVNVKSPSSLRKEHGIRCFVEFKRDMFNEFKNRIPSPIAEKEQHLKQTGFFDPGNLSNARERIMTAIVQRRGQPAFRRQLLQSYDGRCAFSGCEVEAALEAAHINPYRGPETNHPANGLLLRADFHTLFDLGLIAVETKTMTVLIASSLIGTCYQEYDGKPLRVPENPSDGPSLEALDQHRARTRMAPDSGFAENDPRVETRGWTRPSLRDEDRR